MNTLAGAGIGATHPGPIIRAGSISHIQWNKFDRRVYTREYLNALKPTIVLEAIDHWPARRKWTPQFFRERYGTLEVTIDGTLWKLAARLSRADRGSKLLCVCPI